MSESLAPASNVDPVPAFVGPVGTPKLDAQAEAVLRITERLFGSVAAVAERADPELLDEKYLLIRVYAADGDRAFEKQVEWNRWLIENGGPDSSRFRLSVLVRE